jgi:oxygen-dependent protoporphyrinogen oxidase
MVESSAPIATSPTPIERDVVVVGAGISGLTLAFRLQQQGCSVAVVEERPRVGGAITTQSRDGFQWEEGPNSFLPAPEWLNLVADVGIADRLVWADGKLPRFVYWDGELLPVPMSPTAAIGSRLLTLGAKLRALRGVLGFVGYPPDREETVRQFFSRQLGPQVVERLVAPFTSGVYAGDIDQLSAAAAFARLAVLEENYGSLFAGIFQAPKPQRPPLSEAIQPVPQRSQLGNFVKGMQELPTAIASHLGEAIHLEWRALSLQPEGMHYRLQFQTPNGPQTLKASAVAITTPAYAAASLLQPLQPEAAALLDAIPYPHVASVALGYPAEALPTPLQGFGQLFPRGQGIRTLGTIWTSSLFPGRAPKGYHCLLSYIGGATDPEIAKLSDAELVAFVHRDLSRTLLVRQIESCVLGVRRWSQAIPQYVLGHRQRLQRLRELLVDLPGIVLCSNYIDGVALGDCVKRAEAQVAPLLKMVREKS